MNEDQISGTTNQLERFFLRLLVSPYDQRNQNPRLFIGKLPENFPIDIPVPDKTRVLGTLARSEQYLDIVLESDLTRDEIEIFYRTHFTRRDWVEPQDAADFHRHMMGGFTPSFLSDEHKPLTFCQGEHGPTLRVTIFPTEGASTDLKLHINLNSEANPFAHQKLVQRQMPHGLYRAIPVLTPPAGSRQETMNGSGGGNDWQQNSGAILTSNLTLDILAKHYGEQLSRAGWVQSEAGESGPVAWHTWNFADEDQQAWKALFYILKRPDEEQKHLLFVQAERVRTENKNPFAGWLS